MGTGSSLLGFSQDNVLRIGDRHVHIRKVVPVKMVQVKAKQESHLKARNFMPPYTSDPEIHLLRLLPHDPLEETEDAAYWRAWDRALRLDREFPVVRNTSSPRAPPATRQHWPQELLLVKKYRASPTNYVLDSAGRLHAVEVEDSDELANKEESLRRHRRASVPDRLTNHHYHRSFDRQSSHHVQNHNTTVDGELHLKHHHSFEDRDAKENLEGSYRVNDGRIDTYRERRSHNQARADSHDSSRNFDDFGDREDRHSPAGDGHDTERRFLRSRRVHRRHRSPDDRLAASSDEWSPRELREARRSRRARRSAAQRPRRPATDPPPEAPVSDDSDDSAVLFIDNGRIVESEHAESPPAVLSDRGTTNQPPPASPPAPRPPRAVLEYARLERPKRPSTLHPRRRRRSPATGVSPNTETRTKVASATGKTSARTPSRIPRPQLSDSSTRVRDRRGARPAVSSTSDAITDVLVIEHPAEADNMAGNSGTAIVQVREKVRGVTETGSGAHEDSEAPPAIIFHERGVRTADVGNGGGNSSDSAAASPKKGEISAPDSGVASSAASASTGRYIPRRRRSQYSYRDQVSHVMQDISDVGAEDDPFSTEYRDMYKKKEAEKRLKLVQPDTEIYDKSAFEKDTSYQTQYVTHTDDEYKTRSGLRPGTSDLMPKGDFDDGGHGSRHHSEQSESGAENADLGVRGGDQAAEKGAENTGDDVFARAGDEKSAEHDKSLGLTERGEKSRAGSMSAESESTGKGASGGLDAWTDRSAHEESSSHVEKITEPNNAEVKGGDAKKGARAKDVNDDLLKPENTDTDTDKDRTSRDKTKRIDRNRQKSKGRNKSKGRDKSTQRGKSNAKLDAQPAEERRRTRSKSRDGSKRSKSKSRTRDGKSKASDSSITEKLNGTGDSSKESEDDLLNLRKKLTEAKQRRAENEHRRDEMVLLSRSLQEQLSIKRDEDMQKWRELYLQERKLTGPLEESCSTLRRDIEKMHKKLLQRVETRHKGTGKEGPSRKLTMKINSKRLESDIEDWKRRVQAAQLILDTEAKLRQAAEKDVKDLRQELSQKRVSVTQARSQYGLDAVDWYLLLGRQKAAQRGSSGRSPSRQNQTDGEAEPQPA